MKMNEKIYTLRKLKGLTLEEVGKAVGVGKSTVRKWETGAIANMRRDKIAALAAVLDTTPGYLMGWTDESNNTLKTDNLFQIEKRSFPLLGEIACGVPIMATESFPLYVEVGAELQADFCLKCKGDSMTGARILDGDIVFIRKQPMVENGEIAAVIIDDEATLKRVYYDNDNSKLVLQAENPKYAPLVYVGEELNQIRILGKAVAFQSDVM